MLSGQEPRDRQQGNELGLLVFLLKIIVPILPNQILGQSRALRHGAHPQPLVMKQEVSGDAETFNGGTKIFRRNTQLSGDGLKQWIFLRLHTTAHNKLPQCAHRKAIDDRP